MSTSDHKYSIVHKEALAIIFGVKRFHQYLFGSQFTIFSDNHPLKHLFSESRGILVLASVRVQRWALAISAYNYIIQYKPGPAHENELPASAS